MKKTLCLFLILIFFSSIPGGFTLREFAAKNEATWNYDPYTNILMVKWQAMEFKFLPNENFYYQGIRIFHMDDSVRIEGGKFIIPDEFLSRWKIKKGIFDLQLTEKDGNISMNILSDIPLKYRFRSNGKILCVESDAPCFLSEDYYSYPESGIDYIKVINKKDLEIRFKETKGMKEYQPSEDKLMISYSLPIPDEKDITTVVQKKVRYNALDRSKVRIILDPGHGGKDPGAIGITGVQEKGIVLNLGKSLKVHLEKLGYSVLMTRATDVFIPLRNRTRFANSNNGDLFVSIHANFAYNPKVKGFDIYYLSKSASDDESREVAAYENNVIKLEKESKQDMLGEIIWSMMSNEFENESITLAGFVSRELKKITPPNGNPVKHARFYVLYGATMPAILVESGFLSNRDEARKLVKSSYQSKFTASIAEAIDSYIVKNFRKFISG